jgi:hypothetical protein
MYTMVNEGSVVLGALDVCVMWAVTWNEHECILTFAAKQCRPRKNAIDEKTRANNGIIGQPTN